MDSINQNQAETNRKDLVGVDAIERVRDTIKKTASCFFCTAVSTGGSGAVRPMSVQEVDASGVLRPGADRAAATPSHCMNVRFADLFLLLLGRHARWPGWTMSHLQIE